MAPSVLQKHTHFSEFRGLSVHLIPFPLILNQAFPSSFEILTVPVCMTSPKPSTPATMISLSVQVTLTG